MLVDSVRDEDSPPGALASRLNPEPAGTLAVISPCAGDTGGTTDPPSVCTLVEGSVPSLSVLMGLNAGGAPVVADLTEVLGPPAVSNPAGALMWLIRDEDGKPGSDCCKIRSC